jgi:hypothetical protein
LPTKWRGSARGRLRGPGHIVFSAVCWKAPDDEADAFFSAYLDPDGGGYWTDYGALAAGLPSRYHVPDGWPSYDSIAPSIDASFARWRAKAGKPPGA